MARVIDGKITGIHRPLAVFCSQSQAQQYIKTVRNLGDAWQTLADSGNAQADADTTVIETTFNLILKIKNEINDQNISVDIQAQPVRSEEILATGKQQSHSSMEMKKRHYRIFPDYGTDFIWKNESDPYYSREDTYIESSDALSSFPSSILEFYDSWVDVYSDNFKTRCEDTQDYSAPVFATVREEIAWRIAGYLLAWRVAIADEVGSVEYSPGKGRFILERGKETEATVAFLNEQLELLTRQEPYA